MWPVYVAIFLVGVAAGALLCRLYPTWNDKVFREYLRREYGGNEKDGATLRRP
jgi:hypothetical protein